jgi:hypothetical protein
MSSPAKAMDGKIADLTPSELRLMVFSNLCYGETKVHCLRYAVFAPQTFTDTLPQPA